MNNVTGGQRRQGQPRCPHRSLRAYGELLQAPRISYRSTANGCDDRHNVKIMIEVLNIFAIATKEIRQGRASALPLTIYNCQLSANRCIEKYLKKLIGKKEMEDALQRLDKLTQEEARMATAEILRLTQIIDNKVTTVDNKVITVNNKVTNVDNKVTTIGSKVTTIDSKVTTVDNKVTTIVNGEWHVSDWPAHV